jgi:membrane-bound lytic murein transglycosylase D
MIGQQWSSWQVIVFGALVLLLGACTGPQSRRDADTGPVPTQAEVAVETTAPAADAEEPPTSSAAPSPWERLRERFAMSGCDSGAAATQEARRYTRSAGRFSRTLQQAMPLLLLVIDELERRDLPSELALLPYVESHYGLVAGKGGGPAGMWQLMPRTAINHGLRVDGTVDERLDAIASTGAALDLLQRLYARFGDWRLAIMAYNAGEFRLKAELGKSRAPTISPDALNALKLSPVTHQHLARLLALACVVAEPGRFGVELPQATETDVLEVISLSDPVDARLAARLAGMTDPDFFRYNAAARQGTAAPLAKHVLLPKPRVERFRTSLNRIPVDRRGAWRSLRMGESTSLPQMSTRLGIAEELLALANDLDAGADLRAGQELLVPGTTQGKPDAKQADVHVVRKGDTLSRIAHHYGVRLAELLRWNGLGSKSILRIGAQLQIRAPQY